MFKLLYRALLWLYPPGFRRKFARQMEDDFGEMTQRGSGVWLAFLDLVRTVPREWIAILVHTGSGIHPSNIVEEGLDSLQGLARVLRSLTRRPGYTLVVVTSLGIGVGAATAVFSWTETLVLRPLPAVGDLSELVTVNIRDEARPGEDPVSSFQDFIDLRDGLAGVVDLAAFGFGQFTVTPAVESELRRAERVWGAWATPEYFPVLRVRPIAGRLLERDDASSAPPERAALISEGLWTRVFGRDPTVIGRSVYVQGREFEVVAVLPEGFSGTTVGLKLDLWLSTDAAPHLLGASNLLDDRSRRWLRIFGRLVPSADRPMADRAVRAVWGRLETDRLADVSLGAEVVPFDIGIAARLEPLLVILLGLTAFMLVAVCSNVANLTLLRGAAHDHAVAVMRALGAGRRRVAGRVLAESLVVGVMGISAGFVIARYGVRLLPALLPPTPLPLNLEARMDLRVFAFGAGLGLVAALLSGAAPALRTMRSEPVDALKGHGHRTRGSPIQHASLIVVQLALSLGTLVAAGFFIDRLGQLGEVDRGFADPEQVILFPAELPPADAATAWETGAIEGLLRAAGSAPGVRSATVASFVPLGFVGYSELEVSVPGHDARGRRGPTRHLVNRVGPGYFEVMGTRIVAGRAPDAGDVPGSTTAVVVNEAFVEEYWSKLNPVGRGLTLGNRGAVVVGVAADGKYRFDQLAEPTPPFLFVALAQWPSTALTLHLRVDPTATLDVAGVRRAFETSFPLARISGPMSLDEYTSVPLVPVRLGASVLGGLGTLAVGLAALGLYAIMAFRVRQRTREVGLRLAVGAGRTRIVGMFVRQGGGGNAPGKLAAWRATSITPTLALKAE